MRPRQDPRPSYQPLPLPLAGNLEPTTRRALMHGLRRCILRTLNQAQAPLTTADLLSTFPGVTLQTVSYHACVLEDCGAVEGSLEQVPGGLTRSLVSRVAENPQIVAVLQATERLDELVDAPLADPRAAGLPSCGRSAKPADD